MTKRIAVVGGGLGGLAAARALVAAGHDVHVLEAAPRAGGVIASTVADGFLREHAASSFLGGPTDGGLALCDRLGVPIERASDAAKRRWIYLDGRLRALPRGPVELVRSDLLTWRGKLELLREPLKPRRAIGEDESVHDFAARRLGAEVARAIVAPFVTGVFAADAHAISLEAGFPRLAALDADGGLLRGMAKQAARGVAAKLRGGAPKTTQRGLFAPVGGLGALTDALVAGLGTRVRTGVRVGAIEPRAASGVTIDGEAWDGAVLALPAARAAAITGAMPELVERLTPFVRAPAALVYLGVPAEAVPAARDGFGFLVARGEDLRVLGVVFESTVWPDRAPAGAALLRCIFGGGRDPEAAALGDDELIAVARRDVARALACDAQPLHASVIRHPLGIAQYAVGHRDHVRAAAAAARVHRIALAGADYRGASVNELCADAAEVVREVAAW